MHRLFLSLFYFTVPVPAPLNLRTDQVTTTSFRGTWDHGAPDVALYRVMWGPYGEPEKQEVGIFGFLKMSKFNKCGSVNLVII